MLVGMIADNVSTYFKILSLYVPWLPETSIRGRISKEASNSLQKYQRDPIGKVGLPMFCKVCPPVDQQPADLPVPRVGEDCGYEEKRQLVTMANTFHMKCPPDE